MDKVAILIACHARSKETAACVESLKARWPRNLPAKLFAVDDCCPEGSARLALWAWGDGELIPNERPLYWAKSMARAAEAADKEGDFSHHLWINQDTVVEAALDTLFADKTIVAGTCTHNGLPAKGALMHAGSPYRFRMAEPEETPVTFNGNLTAIPKAVFEQVKIKPFKHAFADIAYGLDARRAGFEIKRTPELARTAGQPDNWRDKKAWVERAFACGSPTGLPPEDWWRFCRTYGDWKWPLHFLAAYRFLIKKRERPAAMVAPGSRKEK